jgi:steroid delta-isomerase-like uncharacterized protein
MFYALSHYTGEYAMSLEENKAVARRFLVDIWSQGSDAAAYDILAPSFVFLLGVDPYRVEGPEAFMKIVHRNRTAFRNLTYIPDDDNVVAEGDKVVYPWTMTSKHIGMWAGYPPSNKDVSIKGMTHYVFADGKIVQAQVQNDALGLVRQIGGIPEPGGAEENNAIAKRFFESAWNHGDLAVVDELVTPDTMDYSTLHGQPERGTESFKQIITMFRSAFPDIQLTIDDEIYCGDKVVHRWTLRGTHQAPLMGIPPTSKQVAFTGTTIVQMQDGKIAGRWSNLDMLGLLQQLGAAPSPV